MDDLVLIGTRCGGNEWDAIWGFNENDFCHIYDAECEISNSQPIVLMIINGLKVSEIQTWKNEISRNIEGKNVYGVVHGENKEIQSLFKSPLATYSLGNTNNPPTGSLGDLVIKLASTIKTKNSNDFKSCLNALKSAIRGDKLTKAMRSFLTALSPLSLTKNQAIKSSVCKSLQYLDAEVKNDLRTILEDMSAEISELASCLRDENMDAAVDWAIKNDSMLRFLARRYL